MIQAYSIERENITITDVRNRSTINYDADIVFVYKFILYSLYIRERAKFLVKMANLIPYQKSCVYCKRL